MMIRKKTLKLFFVLLLTSSFLQAQLNHNLSIWDDKPAKDWMTQAYPIGNGKLGGMVFGGVDEEHIQFNESSLWTGDEQETGAYQAFGDVFIKFENIDAAKATQYKRTLDLTNAMHKVDYHIDNLPYSRAYFSSYPDQVMVFNYSSKAKNAYSVIIRLKDAHASKTQGTANQLTISGVLENGLKYASTLQIKHDGGTLTIDKDTDGNSEIHLENANAFTLFLSAATDYINQRAKHWKGENPLQIVNRNLANATAKKYETLKNNHIKDYQNLFNRLALQLGRSNSNVEVPTIQRIINYKKNEDAGLEGLLFQYGRYLLISSSRKGGLPANLQGLWNNSNNPPWRSDYHSNINIQMNYWLAEPANLAESNIPYLDYINSMREVKKENTQKEYPVVRGWTVKTENNIFGGESFLWNTPGSAWYAQALWDHYAFNQDKAYLKTFAYPILKEITEFWDDHLKRRPNGVIVSPNGWSPEHGPREDGVSHDQQIVYDLFTNYIEAADSLNIDKDYRNHISELKNALLKPKIGKWGQLQEWEDDKDDPNDKHRHVSHLYALHPGRQISLTKTPELAKAAEVSLTARGDESTGWSMAWKMNFWARLHNGNHAYKILKNFITLVGGDGVNYDHGGGIYANLLCAHPPFQIDGNFGYTAGVTEMLLQSHEGFIEFLPAIPDQWKAYGEVKGLKARGNITVGFKWENGKVISYNLSGPKVSTMKIKVNGTFTTVKVKKA
jgi:alpha-L-fucosidase 2